MENIINDYKKLKNEIDNIKILPNVDYIINSVGIGIKLSNIENIYNDVPKDMKSYLNKNINRADSIVKILSIIKDSSKCLLLEAGIYEFSLVYSVINNIDNLLIPSIYKDKLNSITKYIDKKSHLYVNKLYNMIMNKDINLQMVAFMQPHEIDEDKWIEILKTHTLRDYYKENIASTDLYQCRNCGESKTQAVQVQTRSCDEPMTIFITCLVCKNRWKKC